MIIPRTARNIQSSPSRANVKCQQTPNLAEQKKTNENNYIYICVWIKFEIILIKREIYKCTETLSKFASFVFAESIDELLFCTFNFQFLEFLHSWCFRFCIFSQILCIATIHLRGNTTSRFIYLFACSWSQREKNKLMQTISLKKWQSSDALPNLVTFAILNAKF